MTPLSDQAKILVAITGLTFAFMGKLPRELQMKMLDDLSADIEKKLQEWQDELLEEQRQTGVALAEALNQRDGK